MVLVLLRALDVHIAGIPVALLWDALRAPMSPNSELGIAIPFGSLVLQKRVPVGLEWARTLEASDWRLHRDTIPGIWNSWKFLRRIVGITLPGVRVQLLCDDPITRDNGEAALRFGNCTELSVVGTLASGVVGR